MKAIERSGVSRQYNPAGLIPIIVCCSIIIFSIGSFVYRGLLRGFYDTSPDLYLFYSVGQLWNEGQDPYNYDLLRNRFIQLAGEDKFISRIFYPPQAVVLFSVLSRLPFEEAKFIYISFNVCLLLIFLLMVTHILSRYRPIGLLEITLLASFTNTIFGRVNIQQTSLSIAVLLLSTFLLSLSGREKLAGVCLSLTSIKPSFTSLFVIYYSMKHYYRLVVTCILSAGAISTLPIILSGRSLVETIGGWITMARWLANSATDINNPSPFEPQSAYLVNLAPFIYRIFNVQSSVTSAISWLILLGLFGYVAYLILRGSRSDKSELLDFSLISALVLISVYHRAYDTFLLFPGLIYIYIYMLNLSNKKAQWRWIIFFVTIMIVLSLPGDLSQTLTNKYPTLPDYYLWRVIAPFQTWAILAVLGVLLWMKTHLRRQYTDQGEGHGSIRTQST